jgi:type IV pilus assembly protein PilA
MYCSRCGAEYQTQAAFCAACGLPVSAESRGTDVLRRPGVITLLAALQLIGATFALLMALGAIASSTTSAIPSERGAMLFLGALLGLVGAAQVSCGVGLLKLKPYGRTLLTAFASVGLLAIPLGTVVGILILVYMSKPGIKLLFSGRQASELSGSELAQVEVATRGSTAATVVIVVVVAVLAIASVGIIAAIAIPALMRARISGNEASALGSLRAITSAQATYASACGQGFYAGTLADLAKSGTANPDGFIGKDLSADPVVKRGYQIALTPGLGAPPGTAGCNAPAVLSRTYFVGAEPLVLHSTGSRYFGTNQTGTIYQSAAVPPAPVGVTQEGQPPSSIPIR